MLPRVPPLDIAKAVAVRGTSGFEALRLLAKEFSMRSRAEAVFFKVRVHDLAGRWFVQVSEVDRYLASALRQDWLGFATGRLDVDVTEILAQ